TAAVGGEAGTAGTGGAAGSGHGGRGAGGAAGRGGGGQAGGTQHSGGAGGDTVPADCPGAAYDGTRPTPLSLSGSLGAHDPAAIVAGGTIYLAATGLVAKTSPDLKTWQAAPTPLALPDWARTATGAKDLWAPDLSSFGGAYHLYYSASTFGSNKSCIGHATRPALDGGTWTDQGMVLCSNAGGAKDDWNAIDPNVAIDEAGTPWLVFGSFWSGIKAVKLDTSGRRADNDMFAIANHADGGIEGAWVFRRCGLYYLFVSWGACCNGAYDYNIRVGRASAITGPYLDKAGSPMMSGGGTQLVKGDASWVAPGHNAVITYAGKTYNLYHALKGGSTGAPTLRISELVWDAEGWPVSGGP
ncbi:MAG TPA: arabinan endo-1,5-alpha-L-arabinosidase, partial [Polyangia bacterium]